jgi:limonene-1,2-epoxide hydrolase
VRPDEFPARFAAGWELPKPEPFLDYFLPLIAPDAVFVQPLYADAHGPAAVARMFRQLFFLLPDLTATPLRSSTSGDTVFIESECAATLGRKAVAFEVCDRFVIRDGLLVHRRSYNDPTPLMPTLLAQPALWPRAVRSRFPQARTPAPSVPVTSHRPRR